jgi:RNA polymerase sigma factor (TIGR02999 family)
VDDLKHSLRPFVSLLFGLPLRLWVEQIMSEFTRILDEAGRGKPQAAEDLLPLVYEELRNLAAGRMSAESETQTLQPTALVHEAWLRLVGSNQPAWKDRAHFFGAAAEAMRRILIERARRRHALKRGAGAKRVDLESIRSAVEADEESLLLVNEALQKLAAQDSQSAELVKLRFFAGLSYEEAAQALGISPRTAKRCWTYARGWLYREILRSTTTSVS